MDSKGEFVQHVPRGAGEEGLRREWFEGLQLGFWELGVCRREGAENFLVFWMRRHVKAIIWKGKASMMGLYPRKRRGIQLHCKRRALMCCMSCLAFYKWVWFQVFGSGHVWIQARTRSDWLPDPKIGSRSGSGFLFRTKIMLQIPFLPRLQNVW